MKIKEVKVEFSLYQNENFKKTKENLLYTFTKIIPFWYFESLEDIEKGLKKYANLMREKFTNAFIKYWK